MLRELLALPFAILAATVLALTMVACGGDDGSGSEPTASAPTPEDGTTAEPAVGGLQLTSTAFEDGGSIPVQYTCNGDNISPPLNVAGVPKGTQTLVLIMTDIDGPGGDFVHWVVFNTIIPGGGVPEGEARPWGGTVGTNAVGAQTYIGPCPPSGEHRYVFDLYALDAFLELAPTARKADVLTAIEGHVLDQTSLTGLYEAATATGTP